MLNERRPPKTRQAHIQHMQNIYLTFYTHFKRLSCHVQWNLDYYTQSMYDSTCNHISITHHIECMQNMCSKHISFSLCMVRDQRMKGQGRRLESNLWEETHLGREHFKCRKHMDQQFHSVYYVHTCTCACASKWFMFTPRIYLYGKCQKN